jgi:hypothetical protein
MSDIRDHHDYDKDANEDCPRKVIPTMANGNGTRAWEMWLKVVSIMILPWMAFSTLLLFSLDKRVAIIENNRFTARDGMLLIDKLDEKADKEDVPPSWLLDRIEHLEDRIDQ